MGLIEYFGGDEPGRSEWDKYERAGLVFRTLGWLSIAWGCVTLIWVFTGVQAGSYWWLIWTIAQFVIGILFLGISERLQARSAHLIPHPEVEVRDRAA